MENQEQARPTRARLLETLALIARELTGGKHPSPVLSDEAFMVDAALVVRAARNGELRRRVWAALHTVQRHLKVPKRERGLRKSAGDLALVFEELADAVRAESSEDAAALVDWIETVQVNVVQGPASASSTTPPPSPALQDALQGSALKAATIISNNPGIEWKALAAALKLDAGGLRARLPRRLRPLGFRFPRDTGKRGIFPPP